MVSPDGWVHRQVFFLPSLVAFRKNTPVCLSVLARKQWVEGGRSSLWVLLTAILELYISWEILMQTNVNFNGKTREHLWRSSVSPSASQRDCCCCCCYIQCSQKTVLCPLSCIPKSPLLFISFICLFVFTESYVSQDSFKFTM